MNYILYDGSVRDALLPFTFTRPVADIRIGILTIREKWEKYLGQTITTVTEDYLSDKYPMVEFDENIMLNASFLPNKSLVDLVSQLKANQLICKQDEIIAFYTSSSQEDVDFEIYEWIEFTDDILSIEHKWDIFQKNDQALREDFNLLTDGEISKPIPETVNVLGSEHVFIEEGAVLNFCTLNANKGPIYIGKNAEIMEGAVIRGPFALCDFSQVKMSAKIYGATTIGPYCKVGGELNNSVLFGYSNKGHDGFLGNSVIGEWCNLGADTNNSNLKNNYSKVDMYNYETEEFENTNTQFCGLMMGDYGKSAINTMFNTGTVVGVFANIFGSGFPPKYIPNFSWGGMNIDNKPYQTEKAIQTTEIVMARRNITLTDIDIQIIKDLFELTKEWS